MIAHRFLFLSILMYLFWIYACSQLLVVYKGILMRRMKSFGMLFPLFPLFPLFSNGSYYWPSTKIVPGPLTIWKYQQEELSYWHGPNQCMALLKIFNPVHRSICQLGFKENEELEITNASVSVSLLALNLLWLQVVSY